MGRIIMRKGYKITEHPNEMKENIAENILLQGFFQWFGKVSLSSSEVGMFSQSLEKWIIVQFFYLMLLFKLFWATLRG